MRWSLILSVLVMCSMGVAEAGPKPKQTVIETKSGQTYKGKIVRESKSKIVLEIRRGKISAEITIPRSEIKQRAKEGGPSAAAKRLGTEADRARQISDSQERAQALMAVAANMQRDADPSQAAKVYLEAARADRAVRDEAEVKAAEAYISAGDLPLAEETLTRTLKRNPKHARAKAVARTLNQALETKAKELLEPGLRAYMDRKPRRALRLLLSAAKQLPQRVLEEASVRTKREFGLSVAEVMVDCRLQAACRKCGGDGVLECPAAASNVSTRCRFGRKLRKTRTERVGKLKFDRFDMCKKCNGRGHLRCRKCDGLGLHLTHPTRFEQAELTKTLQKQLGELEGQAGKLSDKVEKDQREAAVRSVAATELLGVLQEMRSYAKALTKLDPRAGAAGAGDLRRKGKLAAKRTAFLMTGLANALYVAGEKRYEDAVTRNKDSVPLGVRAVRARQAWEIVNQARMFSLDVLELDPSTANPTKGDMKRRLHLMDRFLKRTWKTYLALQAAEKTPMGQLREIFDQATGAAGSGLGSSK
jgi:tetratricopeptide (TPR) repeat protein